MIPRSLLSLLPALLPAVAFGQAKPPPLGAPAGPVAVAPAPPAGAMRRHVDQAGFSIAVPDGWRVAAGGAAEVAVLGPREEAVALVRARVARGPLAAWLARDWPGTEAQVAEARAIRVEAQGADVARGVFLVRDRAGVVRRAVVLAVRRGEVATLFVAAAPEGTGGAEWQRLFAVLDSFRLGGGDGEQAGARPAAALPLARWTDPNEAAFSVDLPAGWRIEGGLLRHGTSPRTAVRAVSPDGRGVIFIGDPALPRFILPSPVLDNLGYREGMSYPGGTDVIMRFRHALEIGPELLQRRLGPLQVTQRRDRPDMAAFRAQRQPVMQGSSAHVTMGEADIRLADGRVALLNVSTSGYVVPGLGGGWAVEDFYGFAGPAPEAAVLGATLARVMGSFAVNPRWFAMERRMQAQDAARWMAYFRDSSARQQAMLEERWESGRQRHEAMQDILGGTVRLTDPRTGERFQAPQGSRFYYRDADPLRPGIMGTEVDTNPLPQLDMRRLLQEGLDIPYR
ncbi:MAG: hypothetical protein ACK4PG_14010 [Acetobacteraceae bacterium]